MCSILPCWPVLHCTNIITFCFIISVPAPSIVTDVRLTRVNATIARLEWQPPARLGGPLARYLLRLRAVDSNGKTLWLQNDTAEAWQTSKNVSLKCEGSTYSLRATVSASSQDGDVYYIGLDSEEVAKDMCTDSGKLSLSWPK